MTNAIEQQARGLLADARKRLGVTPRSSLLAHEATFYDALFHALTPTGENAKHVEVLLDMADQEHLLSNEREAVQFAIRALSAPNNAEAVPSDWCDPLLTGPNKVLHGKPGTWGYTDILRLLNGIRERLAANPTPAARVSVSEADLRKCEAAASLLAQDTMCVEEAAAIYRLVQAVKGEG